MSTISELRADVSANWPDNYHSSDLDDDKIDEFINATQRWVCRGSLILPNTGELIIHNFSWLKREVEGDTVGSQRRYALPDGLTSGVWRFRSEQSCELVNSDNYRKELTRSFKRDIEQDARYQDTTDTGEPDTYCIDDFDLWLYPLPDHSLNNSSAWTINLEYYGYLPDLSDSNTSNILSVDHPEVLEYGATEMGFRFGMDEERAEYWRAKKIELFIEMLRVDQALDYSGIETPIQPLLGQSLGYCEPGTTYGIYTQDTPYS